MTHPQKDKQTPAQRAGFQVGDRAVVVSEEPGGSFRPGSVISLYQDDGSSNPLWKLEGAPPKPIRGPLLGLGIGKIGGYFALAHAQKLAIPHYTPKPGDYVRTANLTESEYHQVAALFMAAGADVGEYPDIPERRLDCFGWYEDGDYLFHSNSWGLWSNGTELALHNGRLMPLDQTEQVIERTDDPDTFRIDARGHVHEPCECVGVADSDLWQELHLLRRRVEKLESSGTEPPDKDARPGGFYDIRPSGFYWVKAYTGKWSPAHWLSNPGYWYISGDDWPKNDRYFITIGPRIHPPED